MTAGQAAAPEAAAPAGYQAGASPDEPGWAWSPAQLRDLAETTANLMAELVAAGRSGPATRRRRWPRR
jgi:hypothetical protein